MKLSKIVSACLCLLLVMGVLSPAAGAATAGEGRVVARTEDYTVTRLSNPESGERETDGLIAGGDRENSYTWRLALRGDEIYIATTRNIASALVNMYGKDFAAAGLSVDSLWAMIDLVTNGDIPRNDANEGANILSYNRVTGEFRVIYTADTGDYFRMAVTFGRNVYFGSYSAVPENPQYILKLDPEGNFTRVFQTMGSVSLRANCVYEDHLFFAGADDRTPVGEDDGAPARMAVLRKSNDDDTVWERVADYRDFGEAAYDPIMSSWAGAPIWELAAHNGWIYATAPSHAGFLIFRGRPAAEEETPNEYGWHWEEVAGLSNGVNNPGLSDVEGGEPGTMRSLIGSVYEWNGTLYAYNFDHSFGGEASAFAGMVQKLAGKDVKASEYLFYLYDSLQNPQKIWALDDETGRFEEVREFTKLTEGTLNEYIWRMGEYDGDLYISTMDAGVFYNYLTQLTNGSFVNGTVEELAQRIGYLRSLLRLMGSTEGIGESALNAVRNALLQGIGLLRTLLTMEIDRDNLAKFLENYDAFKLALAEAMRGALNDLKGKKPDELAAYLLTQDVTDKVLHEGLTLSGILFRDVDVNALIPEELTNEYTQKLITVLSVAQGFGVSYNDMDEFTQTIIRENLKTLLVAYLQTVLDDWTRQINAAFDSVDLEGIRMYVAINDAVRNNEWGFDLFRTSDGKHFEVISRDGFGDKYNYGCPAFLETEEGLYFGTCNPFYGGQLYLLTNCPDETGAVPVPPLPCRTGGSCPGSVFADMPAREHWAHDPIDWAVANGITAGTGENTFSPNVGCTRGQVVTFLWRMAGMPEPTVQNDPFTDVKAGAYYEKAVLWAFERGITAGTSADTFSPEAVCTRGQIVTFLWRYEGEPTAAEFDNPFADVGADAYFEAAVRWAAKTGVTLGTAANAFSPDSPCTRAQIVAFLYRDCSPEWSLETK